MVANAAPVFVDKGHPIDGGRSFTDGKRVFGDGKTVEGFLLGILAGTTVSLIQYFFSRIIYQILLGVMLSVGALLGDLVGAFIKRRLGLPRGHPAPLLDQLDFVLGAYFICAVFNYVGGGNFVVFGDLLPSNVQLQVVLISLYLVPLLHLLTNVGAYFLHLKRTPW